MTDASGEQAEQPGDRPIRAAGVVVSNQPAGGLNWRIRLRVEGFGRWRPGQFVMLSPGVIEAVDRFDPLLPRPMAIYRSQAFAGGSEIEILYKEHGRGTRLLTRAQVGQQVRILGPLGVGFPSPEAGSRVVLVGGGTGVASLYELAVDASQDADVHVILGARDAESLMGDADFADLKVDLRIVTEDGSAGETGRVTDVLEPMLRESRDAKSPLSVYACGPTPMMRRCAELAAEYGQSCVVSLENGMACGFGVCLGCAVPLAAGGFALVCRDGPVFSADVLLWEGLP